MKKFTKTKVNFCNLKVLKNYLHKKIFLNKFWYHVKYEHMIHYLEFIKNNVDLILNITDLLIKNNYNSSKKKYIKYIN